MQIECILFDLDDTLFDATSLASKARIAAIESMVEKGLSIGAEQAYNMLEEIVSEYGSNFDRHFDMLLRRIGQPSIMLVSMAVITYHRVKVQEIRLYSDVFDLLRRLKNMTSARLGIVTDGVPIKQYEKIIRLGLDPFFETIVISDEIGIRKPNPAIFKVALDRLGVPAEKTLYVGDNFEKDIIPAKKAGMLTCYVHRAGKHDKCLDEESTCHVDVEVDEFGGLWEWLAGKLPSK